MKNKKVLITGGAGAIGINLTNRLLELDVDSILIIDNFSSGNEEFIPKNRKVDYKYVDIYRIDTLKSVLDSYKPDYIFHLAAHFANQNSVEHPFSDIQTNVIGTLNLMELLKNAVNLKKVVYTSSSCVYGNVEVMKENSFIYPYETPYAINKYSSELYMKYYAHLFHIPTVSVRLFNTYGPYEKAGKYRNVIPNFIYKALKNENITITGNGNETRDFTYVSDTVELLILAALSKEQSGDVFNGGTGIETKIIDLAEMIIKFSDSSSNIIFKPRRNWDLVTKRVANIEKSKNILGYNPKVSIEKGLKKTIQWYKEFLKERNLNE